MDKAGGKKQFWLVLAVIAGACALRGPITGVGTLIYQIRADFGLNNVVAGFITTIPLLAFAVFSPLVSGWAEKLGTGRVMVGGLVIMAAGMAIRSYAGVAGFFLGTALLGTGMSFANVLLPGITKSAFPQRVGLMTGMYTTFMGTFAGLSIAICVPLSGLSGFGWRGALFVWAALVVVALVFWLPQWRLRLGAGTQNGPGSSKPILRSRLAWSIALFTGLQSLLFYSFVAWLPTILQSKGLAADVAGYFSSIFLWVGLPGGFVVPIIAARMRDQRLVTTVVAAVFTAGLLLFLSPSVPVVLVGTILCGLACGCCLSLAMCLISLRSADAAQTARLSGMAQSFGYALAAVSPTLLGGLFDLTTAWTLPILFLVAMAILFLLAGLKAGKNETI